MDKPLPSNVDAERSVLGAMLADVDAADRLLAWGRLRAEDFYRPEHAALYRLISGLRERGRPCDIVSATEAGRRDLGRLGGAAYVAELPERCVSPMAVLHYAEIVADAARARELYQAAVELQRGVTEQGDVGELARTATARLEAVTAQRTALRDVSLVEAIDALERPTEATVVVPTGFPGLDDMCTGGLRGGELVVVGGRASWGKSAFALSLLVEAAYEGHSCGLISLEMTEDKVVQRLVARITGVPLHVLIRGEPDPSDVQRIAEGCQVAGEMPLRLCCPGVPLPMSVIAQRARRWHRDHGLRMLVIDYLGKIEHVEVKGRSEAKTIGATVGQVKALAVELDIPVVLVAQLNRDTVKVAPRQRKDVEWYHNIPMPQLHQLKETGDIEQDADVVIFPVPADAIRSQGIVANLDAPKGAAILSVAKNRQGRTGIVPVRWHGATTSYRRPLPPPLQLVAGAPERHYSDTERDEEGT